MLPVFQPRLIAGGDLANSFNLLLGLTELFSYMSSSVNLFVYYFTGTRFRETLQSMIRRNPPQIKHSKMKKHSNKVTL